MNTRALFGAAATRPRTHRVRRATAALAATVLTGTLTLAGLPLASADETADPEIVSTEATSEPTTAATASRAEKPQAEPAKAAEPKQDEADEAAPEKSTPPPAKTEAQADEPKTADTSEADQTKDAPGLDQESAKKAISDEPAAEKQQTTDEPAPQKQEKTKKPAEPTTGELVIVKVILPADAKDPQDGTLGGAGWVFTVAAPTAVEGTTTGTTGAESGALFPITLTEGRTAPVTVTEAARDGYSYVGAQCALADGKNTPVTHTELSGSAFKLTVKTKKTTVCLVYNQVDKAKLVPLKVKKTANPAFDRDYDWTLEKTLTSEETAKVTVGHNVTFDYRVVATPSAAQDSNFRITGTITITNPNKVPVPVTVTDDLGIDGATCTIADADNAIVPATDTLALTYECQLPDSTTDTSTGKNTAKVTWDGGKATGHARYAFSPDNAVVTDRTVELSDTAPEFGGTRTLDALDGPQTFTYSRTLGENVTNGTCQTFPNTASIPATTDQPELTDNADATVCAAQETAVKGWTDDGAGKDGEQLAYTGAETDGLLGLAGLAVASGIVLRALARRRRDEDGSL